MKNVLLILSLSLSMMLTAQSTYYPLTDTNLIWHTHNVIYPLGRATDISGSYRVQAGDSTIGPYTYMIVGGGPAGWGGLIRSNTTGRYYIYQRTGDLLLYDFSAHVGDTLHWMAGDTDFYLIDSIYTTTVNNTSRKCLRYVRNDGYEQDTWIEGIGSASYGILSLWRWGSGNFAFCNVTLNGNVIYNGADANTSLCTRTGVHDIPADAMHVYPVPAQDRLTIKIDGHHAISYELYSLQGVMLSAGEAADDVIPLQDISAGIYLLHATDEAGYSRTQKITKE